ncbi:hypothetical protein J2Z66_005729 [Paenibacillus eucommiae]|uniref:Uncharacterized protein n=1 Tax=Paenibacillus eucommiae TaxID=1355755 RepID=A0ABS4J2N5_9BACL|nr:hypothetical protein [Paenibacillus eucommiae]
MRGGGFFIPSAFAARKSPPTKRKSLAGCSSFKGTNLYQWLAVHFADEDLLGTLFWLVDNHTSGFVTGFIAPMMVDLWSILLFS